MNLDGSEDAEGNKSTFIDKILVEMKSEFNKNKTKVEKPSIENKCESETNNSTDSASDRQPPQLKDETNLESAGNASDTELAPPKITRIELSAGGACSAADPADARAKPPSPAKRNKGSGGKVAPRARQVEPGPGGGDGDGAEEAKPRIVLTFRTDKCKPVVTSSYRTDGGKCEADESVSPGRRSLRIKSSAMEDKERRPDAEPGLKRSARRRSKDCNESVLQSAIARKEKSYNETARPQRLTRRLKPTAKILANLEMCQRSGRQRPAETRRAPTAAADPAKPRRRPAGKRPRDAASGAESESERSSCSSQPDEADGARAAGDADPKRARRSHRKSGRSNESGDSGDISEPLSGSLADQESLVPADPECSVLDVCGAAAGAAGGHPARCLCQQRPQVYIATSGPADLVYCTAVDQVEGRVVGCNSVLSGELAVLRPSARVPYILLCEVHRQRLLRHNCCPSCGVFCTQGRFAQCPARHQYHRECAAGTAACCPHCGARTPPRDVLVSMRCARRPVFLPTQRAHFPAARMGFGRKLQDAAAVTVKQEERAASPPLVPPADIPAARRPSVGLGDEAGLDALLECVRLQDCERAAALLAAGRVDLTQRAPGGGTALHAACRAGSLAIAHMLLVAGAERDVLDREQNTPLMLAVQGRHDAVVRYLIKSGACITLKGTDGMSALHLAAKCGNLEACEFLLAAAPAAKDYVNSADDGGWTPLVWACEHGHGAVARYLLRAGADPLLRDVEQNVALHWAAFSGSTAVTELLLNSGCDVNAANAHGDCPLHVAARQDKYNCVLLLLARGANVHVHNKSGETPLDCCVAQPGDCYSAISLNVQLQPATSTSSQRRRTILTNDISRGKETNPVQCINTVDGESKPTDFVYITENCLTSDIDLDYKITTLQACCCEDRCTDGGCVCSNNSLRCWYDDEGRLSADFNYADPPMLFECNPACSCNAITCNNRVVQHGLTQRFQLFRTASKGWGIRTLRRVPRGTYVCEYVGEIISDLDADQREDDSYLFDLDNRDGETYCIDARRYGNLSRFINHSCEPNLLPVRVFVSHQDLRFPRIAFFANRDIDADEELGFDYGEKFWIIKYKSFTCTCGHAACKYSEDSIQGTLQRCGARPPPDA